MAFQVVEIALDDEDNVIERRVVPYPYQTCEEAIDTIETAIARFAESGYETEGKFWWARAANGKARVRFLVEAV